jgi:vitamin B12/bleomycin/antimicrobial peptide transport system ATP-binding/permease protein
MSMKILSLILALLAILALILAQTGRDLSVAVLGVAALMCALTTFRSMSTSSFLKIFVGIFSTETIVFGFAVLAARQGLWPKAYADYVPPDSLPLTVAIFSMVVYFLARLPVLRQILRIADRYYDTTERGEARIWPFAPFSAPEPRIAVAMVISLVLINQLQVGITVRLSFFNRDWFNAIQNKDAPTFWHLLFFVFTPWALLSVTSKVIEFLVQSMLVIRWRRWLTKHFVSLWLDGHAHYRMGLMGTEADNPDQRIAEDVSRFIDAPEDNGIYAYSVLLIATVSSLVSFAIVLWDLSMNFTLPGTDTHVPGFVFWVALLYAAGGTLITHAIGRSLIRLYFERQHVEADFRFSLARLREYGEQVALLSGERTEQLTLRTRFGAIITNFLAIVVRRTKLMAFTATFDQLSPIIPFIFTAPFYFVNKIPLGIMIQTADAFRHVEAALTFFINHYISLASFKSVVDRLSSFDQAIERARALDAVGPAHISEASSTAGVALEDVRITLPDGRCIVEAKRLTFAAGESVLLVGRSGSGKSTVFRAISGIWPFGEGRIQIPDGARVMVVPQKPYTPIGTLRAAVTYPEPADTYPDIDIRRALEDARLDSLADQLDREDIWSRRLSGGELQRIAMARALLMQPDWLFLDEATSAVDERLEADLYRMLGARLPKTTIVSIGHRSTLRAFHKRRIDMTAGEGGLFTPVDVRGQVAR